jgi:hypothetical protein
MPMDDDDFLPGSYGCHEALHMAAYLANAVQEELVEHLAVTQKQEWVQLALRAQQALSDLYQQIGRVHLDAKIGVNRDGGTG